MNVDLDYEQRARVELIAAYSGKSPERVLIDAAQFLLNVEADYYPPSGSAHTQKFLSEDQLENRLARLLRH
ncbi:MAG: hypothetical protein M3O31_13790 [Acidobacteriota bacterium]|nr:hypothetical protein [Acidobacteriota bacterium]